jgi:lipopolysaccharide/colanic/teichoic acid biosynthesis glycosyltransferase
VKRIFDLLIATIVLALILPILLAIAIAVRLDSKGPIFFRQARLGRGLVPFDIFKFRTMVVNAEKMGAGLFNYSADPRITRVGRLLRRTSLDELPQLINVFRGDMSLVGPRPPVTYELGDPAAFGPDLIRRFTVRPGVTGLAQVNGRNELSWDDKIRQDLKYISDFQKYGILLDIKIIAQTAVKVVRMESTFEDPANQAKDAARMQPPPKNDHD